MKQQRQSMPGRSCARLDTWANSWRTLRALSSRAVTPARAATRAPSNASASPVQGLTFADGRTVWQKVASLVQTWAARSVGASGYSLVGAVVSPRDLPSTVLIRELMPNCIFLVPGFGAQGRTAGVSSAIVRARDII